jgi:hypothetical protein
MKRSMVAASALLFVAGALLASTAYALPAYPVAAPPASGIERIPCKYGTEHCAKNPRPSLPKVDGVGGTPIPPSGWVDPDCKSFGNCNVGNPGQWGDPSIARKASRGPKGGQVGTAQTIHRIR